MSDHNAENCAPDLEPLTDWLEDVLVEYDERGDLFGTSGAGAYFLAQHIARALVIRVTSPVENDAHTPGCRDWMDSASGRPCVCHVAKDVPDDY